MISAECEKNIISEESVDFFAQFDGNIENLIKNTNTECFQIIDSGFAVVYYPISELNFYQQRLTDFSSIPKLYGLLDVASAENSGVGRVRRQSELGLLGQGVLVGFVDTGIDYTHPAFRYEDGSSKIVAIWDQTQENGPKPAGFGYGTEYNRELLNQALISENPLGTANTTDVDGHGTFLAGIACGREELIEDFTGYAPLAEIVMVKLKSAKRYLKEYYCVAEDTVCFQENDIALGIRYLREVAEREGKPMVICMGVGSNIQSHDGTDLISRMLDELTSKVGLCAVAAAGNQGDAAAHYRGGLFGGGLDNRISGATRQESQNGPVARQNTNRVQGEAHGYEDMQLRVAENENGFSMTIWGDSPGLFSVGIFSPSGEYTSRIPARTQGSTSVDFAFEGTSLTVSYEQIEQRSGEQLILLQFCRPAAGIWTIRVFYESEYSTVFDAWLPLRTFLEDETYFLAPDPDTTLVEPANSRYSVTVAGYDYRTGGTYIASGRGYTRDQRIKPDIAAPCVDIIGPRIGGGYTTRSGTSIAAAATAGAAALVMEYALVRGRRLYLNGIELRNLLINGARRTSLGTYPNRETGWGYLDVYGALDSLRNR